MTQVLEHLPSKCKVLNLTLSSTKIKKEKRLCLCDPRALSRVDNSVRKGKKPNKSVVCLYDRNQVHTDLKYNAAGVLEMSHIS
jgi:hypothetical protein